MKFLLVVTIISIANANPVPKMLTEEQFLSSGGLDGDRGAVDIVSGYAQVSLKFVYLYKIQLSRPAVGFDSRQGS
jgi:hypothetical protein